MPLTPTEAARLLAAAFITAPTGVAIMCAAARKVIQAEDALFSGLSEALLRKFGSQLPFMAVAPVADFIYAQDALHNAFSPPDSRNAKSGLTPAAESAAPAPLFKPPTRVSFLAPATLQQPAHWALPAYNLPQLDAVGDLCTLLEIHPLRLEKFTKRWRESNMQSPAMDDYFCYWQPKKSGGARLIAHPKSDLKAVQRLLLQRLLNKVAPHQAAHGFRRGHSIVTHAKLHAGQPLVLRCDLQDFFTSIPASRIHGIFRHLGYAEPVAQALTRLCTMRVTPCIARAGKAAGADYEAIKRLQSDHLPQGAPTSPALANLAAFRLDLRLNALSRSCGAVYSRYADDLAFSGAANCSIGGERFYLRVCAIAIEERFAVNMRKTKYLPQAARQSLTGLVINAHPNIARDEYDALKAILHNARKTGLSAQNRDAKPNFAWHLQGRIHFVMQINPARGAKLKTMWEALALTV